MDLKGASVKLDPMNERCDQKEHGALDRLSRTFIVTFERRTQPNRRTSRRRRVHRTHLRSWVLLFCLLLELLLPSLTSQGWKHAEHGRQARKVDDLDYF